MKLKKTLAILLASATIGAAAAMTASALEPHGTGILLRNWLTNDPDYTFSESYKTSVWYENFTALELGENERNNILSIAISQLGYHEGEDGDYSGTNSTSSGNCVEYFRLLIPTWSNNSDEWCACFVNWCLNQAHIDYASSEIGCWKWVGELKGMGMWQDSVTYGGTYTPLPADMIFFNWKHAESKNNASSHIGYVLYTTETHVYTIEGNADNNVTVRSYALDDPSIIGYGTPPYEENDVPTIDHSYKDGRPRGQYVLNASNLYLYEKPGSGRICRVPLGASVMLHREDGDYAYVTYGDKEGYIRKYQLYLMAAVVGEDTLTYDANGGVGAPAPEAVKIGTEATVTTSAPTLEGDAFLGWSTVPYNYKVDYKPGDSITLSGDTTLYAVWEKRSLGLALNKLAAGEVAEFPRPETIDNSSALLLGTLSDLKLFDTRTGLTAVTFAEDAELGRVISLASTGKSDDPHVALDYDALCREQKRAPVSADEVDYIILRVKDVSVNNLFFELFYDCGEGAIHSVSGLLKSSEDWQYLVLDMTEAEGFTGEIERLRLDWQKASNDAGNTLLISDIYFASSATIKDAVLEGMYPFPAEAEYVEPETEPVTAAPTKPAETTGSNGSTGSNAPDTDGATDGTSTPEGTDNDATRPSDGEGCASVAGALTVIALAVAALPVVMKKQKE